MFIAMNKRGQSTLEYAILIAIVVAGLITIQSYVKRGLQGRARSASDDIGEQFDPRKYTQSYGYYSSYDATETVDKGEDKVNDSTTRTNVADQTQVKEDYKEALEELASSPETGIE